MSDATAAILSAIVGAGVSAWVTHWYRGQRDGVERQRTALRLNEEMQSLQFHKQVLGPVAAIAGKWEHLPEDQRHAYRDSVVGGYAYQPDHQQLAPADHFKASPVDEGVSDHEALGRFLTFFSNIDVYLENGILDEKLASELFLPTYLRYLSFIQAFRAEVRARAEQGGGLDYYNLWIDHTEKLESRFTDPARVLWPGLVRAKTQRKALARAPLALAAPGG